MSDSLQDKAAAGDPSRSAEEKAAELTPELRRQAEESERREAEFDDSSAAAPERSGAGVAEHERDMQRRGFEKAGPPE